MERRPEPSTHRSKPECELLRVAGAVGGVVDCAYKSPLPVAKRGLESHGLFVVQHFLATTVLLQEPRIGLGRTEIGLLVEQVEDAGVGLPVLQSFTSGQYVHQLLAVASQSQLRQGVRAGARRRAFPDEPQPPA